MGGKEDPPSKNFPKWKSKLRIQGAEEGREAKKQRLHNFFCWGVIESSEEKTFGFQSFEKEKYEVEGEGGSFIFQTGRRNGGGDSPPICMRGRASKTRSKTNGSRGHSILPLSPLFVSIRSFLPSSHSS